MHLAQQVSVVLTREPRIASGIVALARSSMTGGAGACVKPRASTDMLAAAYPRALYWRQVVDVGGDIGDILRVTEVVVIRVMLHERVPALVVTEIDQLRDEHAQVLAGDRRNPSVCCPAAVSAVAGGAGDKQMLTVHCVRLHAHDGFKFLASTRGALCD